MILLTSKCLEKLVHEEREKNEGVALSPEGPAQGPCNSDIGCPSKGSSTPCRLEIGPDTSCTTLTQLHGS